MRLSQREIALALTALTLFMLRLTINIQYDDAMYSIFALITGGSGLITLVAWIEAIQERGIK